MPIPAPSGNLRTDLANCKAEITRQDSLIAAMTATESAEDAAEAVEDTAHATALANLNASLAAAQTDLAAAEAAGLADAAITTTFGAFLAAVAARGLIQTAPETT